MDNHPKKKTPTNRQWRFTEKPTPVTSLQGYKSVSPKYAVGSYHQHRHSTKNNNPETSKEIYAKNTAELERLVEQLNNNRDRYHTMIGEQTVKSLQHIERSLTPLHGQESQEALRSIITAGQDYRKELLKAQQKKNKVATQSPSSRRQQNLFRDKQALTSENMLLKSQKSLLEKELMIIRDNSDRIKRKYELDLYQANTELEQLRKKVVQLDQQNIYFYNKRQKMRALQMTISDYQALLKRNSGDHQRIRNDNRALKQKAQHYERIYHQLFQNYSKLEVSCQSLQKQVNITKTYHANTQANLTQAKEENYLLQQQRKKIAEEMSQLLNKKSNQIVLLTRKNQQLSGLLQARQSSISQMQQYSDQHNRQLQDLLHKKNQLKNELLTVKNKLTEAQNENLFYTGHISRLTEQVQKHSEQLQNNHNTFEKIYRQYGTKELQWSNILKKNLSQLSQEYNLKLEELTHTIIQHENTIKSLEHELNQAEIENKTLKQINFKLNNELVEYSQNIKQKMLIIHNNKLEIKELEKKSMSGDRKYDETKTLLSNYEQQINSLKKDLSEYKEKQQKLIEERALMSKMIENKTNESEKLKVKMIEVEQTLKDQFNNNFVSLSSQHSKVVKDLQAERQNLMQQNMMKGSRLEEVLTTKSISDEQLKILKIQSQQYEGQLTTTAVQLGTINNEIKRLGEVIAQKDKMIHQLEVEREDLSKINEQKSLYITQLKKELIVQEEQMKETFNQNFEKQHSNHKSELQRKQRQQQQYKRQMEKLRNSNQYLQQQFESLRQRCNADVQHLMAENNGLKGANDGLRNQLTSLTTHYQNFHQTQENILNSVLCRQRSNAELIQRVNQLERQFEDIQLLMKNLHDERQILIKKYIALSNESQKNNPNSSLKRQVQALETHFTNVSVLHTEINRKLSASQLIFREVDKSKSNIGYSVPRQRSTSSRV